MIYQNYYHNKDCSFYSVGDLVIETDPNWGSGMIIKAEVLPGQVKKTVKDNILPTDDEWRYLIRFPKVARKRSAKTIIQSVEVWWFEKRIRLFVDNNLLKVQSR